MQRVGRAKGQRVRVGEESRETELDSVVIGAVDSCLELMEQMPSSTPLDTRLDALCTTKDRAAIQKLLHPSEADLSPRSRNQTLKEAIAKSPTHSARVSNNTDILDDLESLNAHPFVCGDVVLEKGAAPAAPAQVAQDVTASKSEEEIISSF